MTLTTQQGPQTFTGGDQWCAHYVSITAMSGGPVTITSLHFVARSYPFDRVGSFNSSDSLLNEVWQRAANTLAVVTDDAYGSGGSFFPLNPLLFAEVNQCLPSPPSFPFSPYPSHTLFRCPREKCLASGPRTAQFHHHSGGICGPSLAWLFHASVL